MTSLQQAQPVVRERLDRLSLLLTDGDGQLDRRTAAAARRLLHRAGQRLRLSGEHCVVALAGGTGSGKSTLFNALAGLELSSTGARRPTTQAPYACVWGPDPAVELLDWLEVPPGHRIGRASELDAGAATPLAGLVLLDLPDHDSIEVTHRLEVDRLIELVDVLVWVLDPQKYADDSVHEDYLRPLRAYAEVMVVALNQVDRLEPADLSGCEADLRRLLAEDGLDRIRTLSVSALTGTGVDALRDVIAGAVASRQAKVRRVAADLTDLGPRLGSAARAEVDPARVDAFRGPAGAALALFAGVERAGATVQAQQLAAARRRVGWPPLRWRAVAVLPTVPPAVPAEVAALARAPAVQVGKNLGPPWAARAEEQAGAQVPALAGETEAAVRRAMREPAPIPSWERLVGVLQWGLLVVAAGGMVLAFAGLPVAGIAVAVAALALGAVVGALASRSVSDSAAERRRVVERRLRTELDEAAERRLVQPLRAEVERYNLVQRGLRDLAGQTG